MVGTFEGVGLPLTKMRDQNLRRIDSKLNLGPAFEMTLANRDGNVSDSRGSVYVYGSR